MPSPFPGMNPYLEPPSVWHDFLGVLVTLSGTGVTGSASVFASDATSG